MYVSMKRAVSAVRLFHIVFQCHWLWNNGMECCYHIEKNISLQTYCNIFSNLRIMYSFNWIQKHFRNKKLPSSLIYVMLWNAELSKNECNCYCTDKESIFDYFVSPYSTLWSLHNWFLPCFSMHFLLRNKLKLFDKSFIL